MPARPQRLAALFTLAFALNALADVIVKDQNGNTLNASGTLTVVVPQPPAPAPVPAPAPAPVPAPAPAPVPAPNGGTESAVFTPAPNAVISNPERGLYQFAVLNNASAAAANAVRARGLTLTLALIDISAYKTRDIDQAFLDKLSTWADFYRKAGVKLVVRFVYNYPGTLGTQQQDTTADWMVKHAGQLKPWIVADQDVIAHFQTGFIGAWGEWHDSTGGALANKRQVFDAIVAAVPDGVPIETRYPVDLQAFGWPGTVGIHNDCIGSDVTDGWTFQNPSMRNDSDAHMDTRPYGGETCTLPGKTADPSCATALKAAAASNWVYLNANVFSQWTQGGCLGTITNYMGYRFQLDQVQVPANAARGTTIQVNVSLRNVGYARLFSNRRLVVQIRDRATGANYDGTSSSFMSQLPAQATNTSVVPVLIDVPSNAPAGEYEVFISMPDPHAKIAKDPRFAVQFANANSSTGQQWNAAEGTMSGGASVTVK
jgi:hypothetical protein